jgi:hypothetical protein
MADHPGEHSAIGGLDEKTGNNVVVQMEQAEPKRRHERPRLQAFFEFLQFLGDLLMLK